MAVGLCGAAAPAERAWPPRPPRPGWGLPWAPPTHTHTRRTWDILYPEASCRPVSLYLIHFRNTLFMSPWSSLELARELLTSAPTTGDFRKHPRSDRCPQPCSGAVGLWAGQTEEPLSPLGPAPTHLRSSAVVRRVLLVDLCISVSLTKTASSRFSDARLRRNIETAPDFSHRRRHAFSGSSGSALSNNRLYKTCLTNTSRPAEHGIDGDRSC